MVPVSALEVVLVEGETDQIRDRDNANYRIEAERLKLGVSGNMVRLAMVEKLIDMQEKEVAMKERCGEEEVD
ncbi:hypothetical protein A2U01_0000982 [Trifolium medium]|uniref:Uncharacterized protein n=1 Tax=Trifolium medium TaxID=97028 RepID=A0A392LYY2_9FABA|nr:hypothetical protein [Trifolium medium]